MSPSTMSPSQRSLSVSQKAGLYQASQVSQAEKSLLGRRHHRASRDFRYHSYQQEYDLPGCPEGPSLRVRSNEPATKRRYSLANFDDAEDIDQVAGIQGSWRGRLNQLDETLKHIDVKNESMVKICND